MKIPKSIRINGVDYEVIEVPNLANGNSLAYGHIDYENTTIALNPDCQGHQKKCLTLVHEILHGIRHHGGIEIRDEERIVDLFAQGIYQVLQDNAKALFDIKEND